MLEQDIRDQAVRNQDIQVGVVLEDACFTLEQLAAACAVSPDWVVRHVSEGRLTGPGGSVVEWRFTSHDLWRARHIRLIERDFDAEPELAALVADLLEEMEALRARIRRAGLG